MKLLLLLVSTSVPCLQGKRILTKGPTGALLETDEESALAATSGSSVDIDAKDEVMSSGKPFFDTLKNFFSGQKIPERPQPDPENGWKAKVTNAFEKEVEAQIRKEVKDAEKNAAFECAEWAQKPVNTRLDAAIKEDPSLDLNPAGPYIAWKTQEVKKAGEAAREEVKATTDKARADFENHVKPDGELQKSIDSFWTELESLDGKLGDMKKDANAEMDSALLKRCQEEYGKLNNLDMSFFENWPKTEKVLKQQVLTPAKKGHDVCESMAEKLEKKLE